jgi:iron complex outermembrane receptor protein
MNKTRAYRAVTNSVGQLTCSFVLLWPVHSFADVQSANASGSSGLEEIVVTATRQPETAQRTALAISVLSGSDLAERGVTQPKDLSAEVPGLSISTQGDAQIFIRGVGTDAANPQSDGSVAFNLDGVFISNQIAINSLFFDINRVEILKGPQGTLYGRNASGGALNVITNNPVIGQSGGNVSLEVGDYGLITTEGAANLPVNDQLAFRAAYSFARHEGYLSDGYDDEKQGGVRLKALYVPIESLTALLTLDYEQQGGRGEGSVVKPAIEPSNPWLGTANPQSNALILNSPLGFLLAPVLTDGFQNNKTWGASADVEWDLGFATLSLLPGYRSSPTDYRTYTPGFSFGVDEADKQYTSEIRLAHHGDRLQWVTGLYYFNEKINYSSPTYQGLIGSAIGRVIPYNTQSYAGFGEVKYEIFDGFRLIGGLRWTDDQRQIDGSQDAYFPGTTILNPAGSFDFSHTESFVKTNWKVGMEYDVLPQSLLYFTAGTGFKSGGFYPNPGAGEYGPEELTAYELGLKNRFLDNTLEANVEAFFWNYSNHQVPHLIEATSPNGAPTGILTYGTFNAGAAKIKGVEVSLKYLWTPDDTFSANAAYEDSKYETFVYSQPPGIANPSSTACQVGAPAGGSQTVDCSGFPLTRAPRFSGTLGYQHVFALPSGDRMTAAVQSHMSTNYYLAEDYIAAEKAAGYTRTNLSLTYEPMHTQIKITGYVRNVENSAVYTGGIEQPFVPGLFFANIMPPRTYGVRFDVGF